MHKIYITLKYSFIPCLLLLLGLATTAVYGQKEPQYTQYMYNIGSFNPAYVGTVETPEIAALYNELRARAEGTIDASVISAFALDDAQVNKLAKMLKKELNRDVNIESTVDPSIIGGVIIRAGDTVIDGSVAGRLQNLTSYLTR